jgi:hypothetical protein
MMSISMFFSSALILPNPASRSLTIIDIVLDVQLRQPTTTLQQNLSFPLPSLLDALGRRSQARRVKVVKHDDVRSAFNGLIRLDFGLALHLDLEGEASDGASCLYRFGDGPLGQCQQNFHLQTQWQCAPLAQMWLSFSMIMELRSCLCPSIPPISMPYFSTNLKPGVVFRVPAIMPL